MCAGLAFKLFLGPNKSVCWFGSTRSQLPKLDNGSMRTAKFAALRAAIFGPCSMTQPLFRDCGLRTAVLADEPSLSGSRRMMHRTSIPEGGMNVRKRTDASVAPD